MARKSREKLDRSQSLLIGIPLALALMAAAYLAWQMFRTPPTPPGIVSANGRIEATEIDISAKLAGRISEILVNEGDLVWAGQVLVKMDTAVLNAQLREAEAVLAQAEVNVNTTRSQVAQRQAEKASAEAVVVQREAELVAARQRLARAIDLVEKGHVTRQRYDDDPANYESAQAAVTATASRECFFRTDCCIASIPVLARRRAPRLYSANREAAPADLRPFAAPRRRGR